VVVRVKTLARCAATTFIMTTGLGLAGVGAATVAAAQVGYVARYHWCPGDFWRPEWGFNFDGNTCHDDHHRDGDGDNHNNDFWG
jgi:hypothetical protein